MKIPAIRGFAVAVLLALGMAPALAKDETDNSYARLWRIDVMPGKSGDFMQAYNAHLKWRRANGETWSWSAFRPSTGEHINSIYVRSGDHTLADMDAYDAFDAKAGEHWNRTVDQFVQSYETWITKDDKEVDAWPDDLKPNLIQAYTYHLKPGGQQQFDAALKKIHEGLVKVKWGEPYSISRMISGGPGSQVTVVLPYESYADMADPEKSLEMALSEAWGKDEARKLLEQIRGSYTSMDEVLVRFDPDASLMLDN